MTDPLLVAAATVAVALLVGVAAFQVALALGAPWGRASYGGQERVLPTRLRVTSAVAAVAWPLVALVVARRAGAPAWAPLPDVWLPAATWAVAGLLAISVVMNALSRSRVERAIWVPVVAVACASVAVVALRGTVG